MSSEHLAISLMMSCLKAAKICWFHWKKNQAAHFREWVYQAEPLWLGGLKVPPARVFPRVVLVISCLFLRKMYHFIFVFIFIFMFIFIIIHTCTLIYIYIHLQLYVMSITLHVQIARFWCPTFRRGCKTQVSGPYHVGNRGLATRIMYVGMYI